jgi:hypothetical protein
MIYFHTTIPETLRYIERITHIQPKTIDALDDVLADMFDLSQALCPVRTGSLRNSGTTATEVEDDIWQGQMTYGGDSPGYPNDPVVYAGYVRNYYGAASWFDMSVVAYENQFGQAAERNFS